MRAQPCWAAVGFESAAGVLLYFVENKCWIIIKLINSLREIIKNGFSTEVVHGEVKFCLLGNFLVNTQIAYGKLRLWKLNLMYFTLEAQRVRSVWHRTDNSGHWAARILVFVFFRKKS